MPPGEVGEIVYRGPIVMHGYLGQADATAEAFAGGWFHSGDLATGTRRATCGWSTARRT